MHFSESNEPKRDQPEDTQSVAFPVHAGTDTTGIEREWRLAVDATLRDVFGLDFAEASQACEEFERGLGATDPDGMTLAKLHLSPFQVARDLARSDLGMKGYDGYKERKYLDYIRKHHMAVVGELSNGAGARPNSPDDPDFAVQRPVV